MSTVAVWSYGESKIAQVDDYWSYGESGHYRYLESEPPTPPVPDYQRTIYRLLLKP